MLCLVHQSIFQVALAVQIQIVRLIDCRCSGSPRSASCWSGGTRQRLHRRTSWFTNPSKSRCGARRKPWRATEYKSRRPNHGHGCSPARRGSTPSYRLSPCESHGARVPFRSEKAVWPAGAATGLSRGLLDRELVPNHELDDKEAARRQLVQCGPCFRDLIACHWVLWFVTTRISAERRLGFVVQFLAHRTAPWSLRASRQAFAIGHEGFHSQCNQVADSSRSLGRRQRGVR